ncbi:MAG: sigma factor-like helix-turn-helix DNA-binding protein [Streptosporangiaceae bacterium]
MLRHWEQLTEAETAQVLGCSPGTCRVRTCSRPPWSG